MNTAQILDFAIKQAETQETKADEYYEINGHRYYNYIDNASWSAFLEKMRTEYSTIYENYMEGSGDELGVKRVGMYPPKMASYGSSSRMIYLLARNIPGFCFEKKLPTTIGGIANMDGYLNVNGEFIYIEAKCREPYNFHNNIIDRKYEGLYRYLNALQTLDFYCKIDILDDKKMKVDFIVKGKKIERFDLKQMLCHLLGIATERLTMSCSEPIRFFYLLYNPTLLEIQEDKQKEKLLSIYRQETEECDSIPFVELYKAILIYLNETIRSSKNEMIDFDQVSKNFSFTRCDQFSFIDELKQTNMRYVN